MQKLITYLKQGKGRGLLAMLIFSMLAALLLWWNAYPVLKSLPSEYPNISEQSVPWIHLIFILTCILSSWLFYLILVGISSFFCWIFRLKLSKGAVWRSVSLSIIIFCLMSISASLIGSVLLFILGALLPLSAAPLSAVILSVLGPIIYLIVFFVLLVMLVLYSICEPREGKKKK